MINELILDIYICIFFSLGVINLSIVCFWRKDLIKYLPAYISNAIGYIFYTLHIFDYSFRVIGNICYLLTAIFAFLSYYYEYHKTFLKKKKKFNSTSQISVILITLSPILLVIIGLQIIVIFLLIISCLMMIRLFYYKKTPTHLVLILVSIIASFALFTAILNDLEVAGAWELSYIITLLLASLILTMPIVGYTEDKIIKSETKYRDAYNLTEFYKKLLAHDIGNILQNVSSSSEIISLLPENQVNLKNIKEYLDIIRNQVGRGSNLISKIHKLSLFSNSEIKLERIEIIKFLRESITSIKNRFRNKNLTIDLLSEYNEVYVNANNLLFDVFENILLNSVNHNNNQNIEISINLSRIKVKEKNYIKIDIADNGIGIPNDLKENLFQLGINSRVKSKGMGLGLLLVHGIINSYNGKIWIEDRIFGDYSKGSKFIISIPEMFQQYEEIKQ